MQIGILSNLTETPIETIRYYERKKLIEPAKRSTGNYRIYSDSHLRRLQFIRNCRALDMSLKEIRELIDICDQNSENCCEVNLVIDRHLEKISTKLKELNSLEYELREIRDSCKETRTIKECNIINSLTISKISL